MDNTESNTKNNTKYSVRNDTAGVVGDHTYIQNLNSLQVDPSPLKPLPKTLTAQLPKVSISDIIGREAELNELHHRLFNSQKVVLVNGMGGVGKTMLAQAYLSRYWDDYQHVAWVTQSSDTFENDVVSCEGLLKSLNISIDGQQYRELFIEAMTTLRQIKANPNLLIIDNAEMSLNQYINYLPIPPNWHILVTSREIIEDFDKLELGFLSEGAASELFLKYYTRGNYDSDTIKALVKMVDYHTLTVELLAKTAQRYEHYSITDLQTALKNDLRTNVSVPHKKSGEKVQRVASYMKTIFSVQTLDEKECHLLKNFLCLPPEYHTYQRLSELLVSEIDDETEFADTLITLKEKGWLLQGRESSGYKMHRIVAEAIKQQLPVTLDDIEQLLKAVINKLYINENKDNPVDKFEWRFFGEAILSLFTSSHDTSIARLQNNLALVLKSLGDYQSAKVLLEQTVTFYKEHHGDMDAWTARAYSSLGLVLRALGDYDNAKQLFEKALAAYKESYGETHPYTATSYSNLGLLLQDLGEYESAKELHEKALAADKKELGDEHPSTTNSYSNLALALKDLGDYEEAKILLEKAVASDEKHFGETHPNTARSYSSLGLVLKALEEHDRAKVLLEKAMNSYEKGFGEGHPYAATSYSNLASVYSAMGDYEGAKALHEKAVTSNEKNFGVEHPATAMAYWNLASVLNSLQDYQNALNLVDKAHQIFSHFLPDSHPNVKNTQVWSERIKENLEYSNIKEP